MATPSRDVRAVLSHAQFYRLCEWIRTTDAEGQHVNLMGVYTRTALARRASDALQTPISEHSIGNALETVEVNLPKTPNTTQANSSTHDRARVVARELAALMRELGKEPSEALKLIASGRSLSEAKSSQPTA